MAEDAASAPVIAGFECTPPVSSATDAKVDTLEATLLDQLRALEETLQEPAASAPPSPRRPPLLAEPVATAGRSAFAPDPVRQRTYVDLRDPAPARPIADDAPWRKYLSEPGEKPVSRPIRHAASRPARTRRAPPPAAEERQERGQGLRALSVAAILGLGVGVGLLVLFRPVGEAPVPVATVETETPVAVASAVGSAPRAVAPHSVGPALEALLANPTPVAHAGPAVIAEAGTPPEALAGAVAPVPPPVIAPMAAEPIQVARAPVTYGPEAPAMAYGPTPDPAYDPASESLIRDPAVVATEEALAPAPAVGSTGRGSRATVASSVNMRARPENGAPVVAVLAQGLPVQVLGCDYWCEVDAGGKRGYVYKKFVGR